MQTQRKVKNTDTIQNPVNPAGERDKENSGIFTKQGERWKAQIRSVKVGSNNTKSHVTNLQNKSENNCIKNLSDYIVCFVGRHCGAFSPLSKIKREKKHSMLGLRFSRPASSDLFPWTKQDEQL